MHTCLINCQSKMHYQKHILGAILLSIITEISGNASCRKENEVINSDDNRCETHCGFQSFIEFESNKPNCNCKPNFARNNKGECVPYERCIHDCDENERFVNSTKSGDFLCKCAPGYFRKNGVCSPCTDPAENIHRCKRFHKEKCSCKDCRADSTLCKGVCRKNHLNCANYNYHYCICTECNEGFTLCDGKCKAKCSITCKPHEIKDENTCTCKSCSNGQIACKGLCREFPSHCTKFHMSKCRCIQCESGYMLQKGQCVLKESCITCPYNETYQKYDSSCVPTCTNPKPGNCASTIVQGCTCSAGYVLDTINYECVKLVDCPRCPAYEEYLQCGSACPPTCDTPNPLICTKQCVSGCFCKAGFVRDLNTGKCVELDKCSCSFENTQFCICGPSRPPTCNNPFLANDNPNCDPSPGCYCVEGTVRDTNTGQCVPPEKCSCGRENEVYKTCGTLCEPTCENREPQICPAVCVSGCFCKDGYIKNDKGECVLPCECERTPKCPNPNEEYNDCGTHCPITCQHRLPKPCIKSCNPGCFCANGTIRDEKTGLCVNPEQCCSLSNEAYFECHREHPEGPCEEGCFCVEGTTRNGNGECVPISNESSC